MQQADAIVYDSTAQASFVRSRIDPELRATVEAVPGVTAVGGSGSCSSAPGCPATGARSRQRRAVRLRTRARRRARHAARRPGVRRRRAEGRRHRGRHDDRTRPGRTPVEIIGFVTDTSYSGQGSLWASPTTWRDTLAANRPDAQVADGVFQALVVQGDGGRICRRRSTPRPTARPNRSRSQGAVDAIPGVEQQRSTFAQIIGVTVAIALVVIALFFALLTVERTALYGVLKALGHGRARSSPASCCRRSWSRSIAAVVARHAACWCSTS